MSSQNSLCNYEQCYQVDCIKKSSGKQIAKTKRHICWKFGFTDEGALSSRCQGSDCRGREHEINFIWSIASGKRSIVFDGETVHFSVRPRDKKFQYSWAIQSGHVIEIIAYALPTFRANPHRRQFDLVLDGTSFYDFPKIFELGLATELLCDFTKATRGEDFKSNTMDLHGHASSQSNVQHGDLLDFSFDPTPVSVTAVTAPFFGNEEKNDDNLTQFETSMDFKFAHVSSKENVIEANGIRNEHLSDSIWNLPSFTAYEAGTYHECNHGRHY